MIVPEIVYIVCAYDGCSKITSEIFGWYGFATKREAESFVMAYESDRRHEVDIFSFNAIRGMRKLARVDLETEVGYAYGYMFEPSEYSAICHAINSAYIALVGNMYVPISKGENYSLDN